MQISQARRFLKPPYLQGRSFSMGKYIIHQHTQCGQIVSSVGDHQHITITQTQTTVTGGKDVQPPVTPDQWECDWPCDEVTGDETIIAPIGGESQIYVNGKRVQ
jgi:hypothetical protein